MTTDELIEMLKREDPTGQLPVVVGSEDIYFVERQPGYYDGCYQQLIHDPEKRGKQYSITGVKITTKGYKVKLVTCNLDDVLLDHPEIPVDLSELSEHKRNYWEHCVESLRQEYRDANSEVTQSIAQEKENGKL